MLTEEFTKQDLMLLALLQRNLRDDQIAAALYVGERTMQRQLKRLMERLGACNRFSLGVKAAALGLVTPD
jgi:DNA-binding NarL/FixJ family response regulator